MKVQDDTLLLSREQVEARFGLSARWLEVAAHRGYGPPFFKISRRMVRYRAAEVERWLKSRAQDFSPSQGGLDDKK